MTAADRAVFIITHASQHRLLCVGSKEHEASIAPHSFPGEDSEIARKLGCCRHMFKSSAKAVCCTQTGRTESILGESAPGVSKLTGVRADESRAPHAGAVE